MLESFVAAHGIEMADDETLKPPAISSRKPTIIRVKPGNTSNVANSKDPVPVPLRKPVPVARTRPQTFGGSLLAKTQLEKAQTLPKPLPAAKPLLAPKPKPPVAAKPKSINSPLSVDTRCNQDDNVVKSRPKSLGLMHGSGHSQIAAELANILSRPRSSSRGLLSPQKYSDDDDVNVTPVQKVDNIPAHPGDGNILLCL